MLQWISVSPNYQDHFATHLVLSPQFIFDTIITIRWVKIFIILVENSRENRSTYVCNNENWWTEVILDGDEVTQFCFCIIWFS
jgi:hypothetical protein